LLKGLHAATGHELQHKPINRLCIDYIPLYRLGTLEDLFDYCRVAGGGEGGKARVDDEVVKRCDYRVTVPFGGLVVVFRQR
jgi:hypothetical protein